MKLKKSDIAEIIAGLLEDMAVLGIAPEDDNSLWEEAQPCECAECKADRAEEQEALSNSWFAEEFDNESTKPKLDIEAGWLCPRCNRINAPWLPWCDCHEAKG